MSKPQVLALGHGRYLVRHAEQAQQLAWAVADGTATWVFVDGRGYRVGQADETARRPRAHANDDQASLAAPMPATVAAVHVSPGQQVAQGDVLLTLEAMKMELPITAPRSGVVTSVSCKVGDLVQPGVTLVALG